MRSRAAGAGRAAVAVAARRAERTAVSFETARFIERNIPNFEILNEEALQIIEWNAETVLEEIGVNFVENPAALELWRAAGADVKGERVRIPRGLARKLCSTAPRDLYPARPQPGAQCRDRRPQSGAGPGLRPALRARCGRWAALCHDRRISRIS